MSRVCKLALALTGLVCTPANWADDAVSAPDCSSNVCVLNVLAPSLVTEPCTGYSVLVAYSTSTGATLIQCSSPSNAQENKAFVYDRRKPEGRPVQFSGGRFIRPDSWARIVAEGVPDKFAAVPLCPAKDRRAVEDGQLVIVKKELAAGDDGYCYRVNYVEAEDGRVTIRSDQGRVSPALPKAASAKWAKLKERLSGYVPKADPTGASQR